VLKNAYFLEKDVKNRLSVGETSPESPLASDGWELRPKTLALLLWPAITTLSSSFLALNAVYYLQKGTNFCSYFSLQTLVFVDRGRKNISCPRAQGT